MKAPPKIPELAGLRALVDQFDCFILDQFGVLHDGTAPYPGAVEALALLKAEGKKVLLLSNSGKRSAPNEARLERLGFARAGWDHFLSSGEVAWRRLARLLDGQASELRCLLIARDGDRSAVDGLPLMLTGNGGAADIVLISASEGDRYGLDHYREMLEPAAARGVPCLCTNPDRIMLTPGGPRFGAGQIAELYTGLGGEVEWIGKPYPEIYDAALDLLGRPAADRIVCVGDSIEHDIAGAWAMGLRSVLVATGILAEESGAERARLFSAHGATPDFLLRSFRW